MKASIKKFKSSALIQSISIVGLCLIIYWLGPISTWETNDDVYYNLVLSGKLLTSAPDAHVVVINIALSAVFVTLYKFIPAIPWYGLFHVASIVLSIFFLNYLFALARNNSKFVMRMVISLACALPFLFYLQFTKTAMVLGIAGYLGFYLLNEIDLRLRLQSLFLYACSSLFLVLSYSLRKESFYLATILCAILIAGALMKRKKALFISLSVTALFILAFAMLHGNNYGADWQGSKALDQILNYDQFHYDENKKVYDEAGLSRNDYMFLKSWGYIDDKVYSVERLDFILNNAQKKAVEKAVLPALRNAVAFPAKNYLLTLSVLALSAFFIYRQKYSALSVGLALSFALCVGVLVWQGRFPTRVSTSMAFAVPWFVLLQCGELRTRLITAVVAVISLVAIALPVYGQYQDLSVISRSRLAQNQELRQLGEAISKTPVVLVTLGASFPYEGILPFESPDYLSAANLVWLCGMNQYPVQKKQLADNHISDIFATLITDSSTFIVLHPMQRSMMQRYIYEHYQKNVSVMPVFNRRSFVMYQLRLTPGSN